MATGTIEERVERLEEEISRLKHRPSDTPVEPWWERIRGDFKGDPDYAEAMRLGREYRESLPAKGDEGHPR